VAEAAGPPGGGGGGGGAGSPSDRAAGGVGCVTEGVDRGDEGVSAS
jgi:hypothetical protein